MFKRKSEEKKMVAFSLDPNLVIELKRTAKKVGITQRSLVEVAIKKILDEIKEHGVEL
ncbi:MAG: hypothetical protein ACRC7S_13170 [Cetobacterium sp.]|uniref:hypothetical protein n=1 Tax=uncultured Cetobacterium sp. TaxID=527638 RepID=UPI00260B6359|nr:hypothetical protein [uncultured Cetobacterium sp.]